MKKIIYLILIVFTAVTSFAQQLVLNPKSRSVEGPNTATNGLYDKPAQVSITNNATSSNDSMVLWEIIERNVPTGWGFDFCDPNLCLFDLQLGDIDSFVLRKGEAAPLKGMFASKGLAGNASVKIKLWLSNHPTESDTITLIGKGWATGLSKVKKSSEVTFYPNPAKDQITIKYTATKPIEGTVYNVLGSKVKSFQLSGTETAINISDLQSGVYFIRFVDGGNMVAKSFTKN